MAKEKKGFVLYFNQFDNIRILPMDQRGMLFTALFEYAELEAAATEPQGLEPVLARYPDMSPECRMAFGFTAGVVRMDTEKWRNRRQGTYRSKRDRLSEVQAEDEAWKYVERRP